MKRRTILQRIGSVGAASIALTGSATASSDPPVNIDREIDVADVSGYVPLESVLSDADLAQLPDDLDPTEVQMGVAESTTSIQPSACCYGDCDFECYKSCDTGDCCYCK